MADTSEATTNTRRTRLPAGVRSELILDAAISAFAARGYASTTTREIAERAGVSQPYVVRLFGGKRKLFHAAIDRSFDRYESLLRTETQPGARSTRADLAEPEAMVMLIHGFSEAGADSDLRLGIQQRLHRVVELSGAGSDPEGRARIEADLLVAVLVAIQAAGPGTNPPPWAQTMLSRPGAGS
ncbi:helix-turn-helix domain-containing protein [Nocardia asteroides]|uniref:TetR/AcrR family transcriptional regulator n=1 Tax=Nocardia asteroides TaxID=1824 RepID=UPI00341E28A6